MGRNPSGRCSCCDFRDCGEAATTIHIIPNVPDCREVKLGCGRHSFAVNGQAIDIEEETDRVDAYWFDLDRWQSGEMERHIAEKINGDEAVAKIRERLDE
jgi:hypothetical protein